MWVLPWLGLLTACAAAEPDVPWTASEDRVAALIEDVPTAFSTVAVTRGLTTLDVAPVQHTTTTTGVETIARSRFVETLQPLPDGTEQTWSFAQAPGSAGDLTITVDAGGLELKSTDSDGIELQQRGAFEIRYSHGTWIDAHGTQTAIPTRFDHGRIVLTVPADVVNASMFPAVLDPKIVVTVEP